MKVIQKKISLEPFISRMPSFIPAYDENGEYHMFSFNDGVTEKAINNYGMIPCNVSITNNSSYSGNQYTFNELSEMLHDLNSFYIDDVDTKCNSKQYEELSNNDKLLYGWLTNYAYPIFVFKKELENVENINKIIKTWGTYYLTFQDVKKWINKLQTWSGSAECCIRNDYDERGGNSVLQKLQQWYDERKENGITVCDIDKIGYSDTQVFSCITSDAYIFVDTHITKNGKRYVGSHKFKINQPKVRILGNNRFIQYGEIIYDDEGTYYVKNAQKIELISDENGTEKVTINLNLHNNENILCVSLPYCTIPIVLTNSIDDMGEMSLMTDEWERGHDYTNSNSVVTYNNDIWKYSTGKGYYESQQFQELYFASISGMTEEERVKYLENGNRNDSPNWGKYIETFPINNSTTIVNTYTYKNEQIIVNPVPQTMCDKYEVIINEVIWNEDNKIYSYLGFMKKGGKYYPIIRPDYIQVKTDTTKYYEVSYGYQNGNVKSKPYVIIDGRKKYAVMNSKGIYEFILNNEHVEITKNSGIDFYHYQNELKETTKIEEFLENGEYEGVVIGYSFFNGEYYDIIDRNGGKYLYNRHFNSGPISLGNEWNIETMDYSENNMEFILKDWGTLNPYLEVVEKYEEHNPNKLSGYTTSKLSQFEDTMNYDFDNMGNKMPYIKWGEYNVIPYYPEMVIDKEAIINDKGEIIGYWGNKIESIKIEDKIYYQKDTFYNAISNITTIPNTLNCEVEYYMGTILDENNNLIYKSQLSDYKKYHGVKYVDKIQLVNDNIVYYKDSVMKEIRGYWKIIWDEKTYDNQDYNLTNLNEKTAYFEACLNILKMEKSIDNSGENITFYRAIDDEGEELKDYEEKYNGFAFAPLCREEYKLGISLNEKIESDIYINRGTARAIDYHLRLMEAKSLESLEQIGNGFFNIKK